VNLPLAGGETASTRAPFASSSLAMSTSPLAAA
jgi:hypothetical protein